MITITREAVTIADEDAVTHAWPLRVTATTTDSFPAEVFVYHAGMPGQPEQDVFECVASLQQLAELPLERPAEGADALIPYYRVSVMEVWCRDALQAQTVWEELKEEIDLLYENWMSAQDLSEIDSYTR